MTRHLATVAGVLALLGTVAVAPHAWEYARVRVRQAPFQLENVTIRGLERLSAEEVAAVLAAPRGVALVDLDVARLASRLESHPWIAEATLLRWPPDTLRVRVRERRPLAVTPAGPEGVLHGVDETGTAFAPAGPEDAAHLVAIAIALDPPPAPGEPDPRLLEALRLAASLRQRGLEVPRRVTLGLPGRERSAELRLRGFAPAVWIERSESEPQLDRLALLLAAHVEQTAQARVIDLRFGRRAVLWRGSGRGGPDGFPERP